MTFALLRSYRTASSRPKASCRARPPCSAAPDRVELVPTCRRETAAEVASSWASERRRRDGAGEDAQRPRRRAQLGDCSRRHNAFPERAHDIASPARDDLCAIGIVERQDRRLHEDVGPAEARRMIGIALDLDRPALVALDEHAAP